MKIKFKIIDKSLTTKIPAYATEHAAGMDISSASVDDIVIQPMCTELVPTNLVMEIPPGYEGQVRPRSGLAMKYNIGIVNSPGTIDADYRGEVKVLLTNYGKDPFTVKNGDRIAQLIINKIEKAEIEIVDNLSGTSRSTGGFGHTGI